MPQTWKPLACPSLAPQIQGLHTGPLKYHPDNSTLIPKLGRSPGPGSPQPAPAGSSLPKPPAPTSYLGFSFCESSNPFYGEGGGQREQLSSGQSNSCVSRQTAAWARFLPLHQRGGRKGLSPVTLLRPVFWNRTWRTMRMEPRPLRSRMGEPAPGQGQVGTHPILLAPCFCLLSPGPCSGLHLTSLSSLTSCPTRDSYTGSPVLHPTLVPASPTHPTRLFILQKPPALEFLFNPSLLSAPYPAGNTQFQSLHHPPGRHHDSCPKGSPCSPPLAPSLGPFVLQGFWPNIHPQLPVVL